MQLAVRLDAIIKTFDGNRALDGAALEAGWGRVHGLLGENGAGKSSLMNVLAGIYSPESGTIEIDGQSVSIDSPATSHGFGIGMVHQHFKLVRPFSVAENILLSNPRGSWRQGLAHVSAQIKKLSDDLGFGIEPNARVDTISIAERQRVEIIKVLMGGSRILVLDEPTSVLTDDEAVRLLAVVRRLAEVDGCCVILITHKLREVLDCADDITVMREGKTVARTTPAEADAKELARLMVGSTPPEQGAPPATGGALRLKVNDVAAIRGDGHTTVDGLNFFARGGQIYGIAGVGGNGQAELVELLLGARAPTAGSVELDGHDITHESAGRRRMRGLRLVSADRYRYGLAADLPVSTNLIATKLSEGSLGGFFWTSSDAVKSFTEEAIAAADIRGATPNTPARLLSGGNAQKLVLARELAGEPAVLIVHSPTQGLDVHAAAAVHGRIIAARDSGAAVVLISEDLDEILKLSDVVGVMNRGRIAGEFERPVDRQAVGERMVGHA